MCHAVGRPIQNLGINYHQYADDILPYTKNTSGSYNRHSGHHPSAVCCVNTRLFSQNGSLLNPDKSEVIYFRTRQHLRISELSQTVTISGSSITVTDRRKVLGVVLDSFLTFSDHVLNTVRNCNFHLRVLIHIRSLLTSVVANMMACCIIGVRIDHCNLVLIGISEQNLGR